MPNESQFLRDLFELIALNHVAHLIFAKITQLDSTLQTGTHLFYVVLKTAQRRNPAVINRLTLSENASARRASNPTIGHQATSDNASAQFKNLFYLGVSDHCF